MKMRLKFAWLVSALIAIGGCTSDSAQNSNDMHFNRSSGMGTFSPSTGINGFQGSQSFRPNTPTMHPPTPQPFSGGFRGY